MQIIINMCSMQETRLTRWYRQSDVESINQSMYYLLDTKKMKKRNEKAIHDLLLKQSVRTQRPKAWSK